MKKKNLSESTEIQSYYRGRRLRIKQWRNLYADVVEKLHETTIILFLIWLYDELCSYLEKTKSKLPGNMTIIITYNNQPASYYWIDCAMLYLIWNLDYLSEEKLEKKYDIPKSSAWTIIDFMNKRVYFILFIIH